MGNIEAQLYRGGGFIDLLTTRSGSADEVFLDIAVVNFDLGGYLYRQKDFLKNLSPALRSGLSVVLPLFLR